MTASGIEPATFQFVAQHLNHCATAVKAVQTELVHPHVCHRNEIPERILIVE